MEYRTLTAAVLLGLLVSVSCQQPPPLTPDTLEEPPADRQIGALLLGLITPTITNLLTTGATNLATAIYNAFTATMSGKTLELIPLESLLATPIGEDAPATGHPPGFHPKRRPYSRAVDLDTDSPLHTSEPKTPESS